MQTSAVFPSPWDQSILKLLQGLINTAPLPHYNKSEAYSIFLNFNLKSETGQWYQYPYYQESISNYQPLPYRRTFCTFPVNLHC